MASSHSTSSSSSSLPKWPIVVALGATGVGLGYWYFRRRNSRNDLKRGKLGEKQSISIEGDSSKEIKEAQSPLDQAQRYKTEGNNFFKKGKYDEAISCYNKAIEVCPPENTNDLATFYQNRAAAYEHLKKWSSVISDCTEALNNNEKYEKALYRRARAYESIKDWENCLDDVTAICLLQNFQNQNVLYMADRVLKELGKQHAAEAIKHREPRLPSKQFIKTYFMSFSADPVYNFLMSTENPLGENELTGFLKAKLSFATDFYDDIIPACTEEINSSESESQYIIEALSLRASFYLLSGSYKEALEDFETIINTKDADVKIKVNCLIKRASLHLQLEENDKCLEDFELAAELCSDISDIYHHRGQVNLLMDKTEEARQDFEKAVELNPNFAIAVVQKCYADNRYAMATQNVKMLMDNLEDFRKTIRDFPTCLEVYVLYGQILTEKQEFEQADAMYIKAMEIEPDNATILVHRGVLLLQWKGDIENSVEFMKSAIKLDDKCEFAYETLGTVEVQRGNLILAVDLFDKAINLARTEMEMMHLFSLRDAAVSQLKVTTKLGIGPQLLKMNV